MLGKVCMTLLPDEIVCSVVGDTKFKASYVEGENFGLNYRPSFNIQPGDLVPIMISANHFENSDDNDFMVVPALWGLIPRWHKGFYNDHGFNTTNFGLENMDTSRMYKPAFNRGQRCVLMCEGFYEHQRETYQTPPKERSIYFIHLKQPRGVKIYDKSTWNRLSINLIYIAGIFDIWTDDFGSEIYNFTILSMSSENNNMNWIHPRMPVILRSKRQVFGWLDHYGYPPDEALSLIKSPDNLELRAYRVRNHVLDSKKKGRHCSKPLNDTSSDDDDEDWIN